MSEPGFDHRTTAGTAIVAASARARAASGHRPDTPLLAQLMAARLDAPQTRARRRIGLTEGIAAYGAAGETIQLGRRAAGASVIA